MTLPASVCCSWTALNYLSQHVVQRADELCRLGRDDLLRTVLLLYLDGPTIVGCDNRSNAMAVVINCCGIFLTGTMARVAVHVLLGVGVLSPLLHNASRATALAIWTCFAFWGNLGTSTCNQRERRKPRELERASKPPLDNIFTAIISSLTLVPIAEELHPQRHHPPHGLCHAVRPLRSPRIHQPPNRCSEVATGCDQSGGQTHVGPASLFLDARRWCGHGFQLRFVRPFSIAIARGKRMCSRWIC